MTVAVVRLRDFVVVIVGATGDVLMILGFTSGCLMGSFGDCTFVTIGGVSVRAACCSMVRGGRFGTTRSGNGVVGAFP